MNKKTARGKVITKPAGSRKAGRPKKVDATKVADRSPEVIRAAAAKRREAAKKYNDGAGALAGQRLVVKEDKNFFRRWFNDDGKGGIDKALSLGYYFVQEDRSGEFIPTESLGSRKSRKVGTKDGGGAMTAYLMEIPQEDRQESQLAKENNLRKLEDQIRRGESGGTGVQGAYNPSPHSNNINEV